ncbi:d-3-phosphoglycerate dehydrogenase chloroplastic-like, partial [Trifolium pratense]
CLITFQNDYQEGVAIEIAEAVVGALKGELASTAVNAPMVPSEVLTELKPFVDLAEKLGRLAVQLVAGGSGVKTVKVTYASARAPDDLDTRLLRAMITKGLIEPISSVFVNLVNADFTAKQRGIRITEERVILDGSPENPLEFIQVQIANVESRFASAISDSGEITVEGRVKDGVPHLTKVGSFEVDVSLEGSIILCRQVDQPGMIGKVGSILGEENVNVSFMSVGRIAPRKQAVMAIGVDDQPRKETLKRIGDIPAVEEFGIIVHWRDLQQILNSGLYGFNINDRPLNSILEKIQEHEHPIAMGVLLVGWIQPEAGDHWIEMEIAALYLGVEQFGHNDLKTIISFLRDEP